ncbi:tetratricopeptide repeat protein [Roseovarius sp. 2305UL8-3]|uniref:tetratricopeptide repeat protein n=1 Tax=Roseovarius conchicola TaxID=3121636 RepID=UPI003528084E
MIRAARYSLLILFLATAPALAQQASSDQLMAQAEAGDPSAQSALAFAYHDGTNVAQNFSTAAEWAARAAEGGDAKAQNLLGRYYHSGLGIEQNQAEALRWLKAAAEGGDPDHLYDLGRALEHGADGSSDPAAAAQAYAWASKSGHLEAIVSLGVLYQEGSGVAQDYAEAHMLYEQAAAKGHARAQNNLGLLYVRGHGVPQDYETAAKLFAAAAEQGSPDGMRNLGVLYENGFGVPLDEAFATELYRRAGGAAPQNTPVLRYDPRLTPLPNDDDSIALVRQAAQAGDPVAQFQLGWYLIKTPDGTAATLTEAVEMFRAAAESGYGPAMRNLGILYFEGRGVPQDYVLGRMWLTLAGSAGQTDAADVIDALGSSMTASQINDAQFRAVKFLERKS